MTETPILFDRSLVRLRRVRALRQSGGDDFLLERAAQEIGERIGDVTRSFVDGVAVNARGNALARAIAASGKIERLVTADMTAYASAARPDIVIDDERLPLAPESVDLYASALFLHWANDLPGALIQIRQALRPDGLFLAALLGGETLAELRQALLEAESEISGGAAMRVAPSADIRDLGGLLQRAGFALPVVDSDRLQVRYDNAFALFDDLRALGLTSVLSGRPQHFARRRLFIRTAEIYAERFGHEDGRIPATFETVYLTGWAPHESQPKPLQPGSARTRLADALGVDEHKLKR